MKNVLNNKKGFFSILFVALIFILLLAVTAFTDITSKTYTLNEIQGNMDMAGLNSLNSAVDLKNLRAEIISIGSSNSIDVGDKNNVIIKKNTQYENIIANKYRAEISKFVKANSDNIKSFNEKRIKVYFEYSNKGLGTSADKKAQIVVDATYNAEVKVSSQFDTHGNISKKLRDGYGNKDFIITQQGTTEDGYANLIIRSVSRLVLR